MTTLTALLEQAGVQLPPEVQGGRPAHILWLSSPLPQIGMRLFLTPNIKVALTIAKHVVAWQKRIILEINKTNHVVHLGQARISNQNI